MLKTLLFGTAITLAAASTFAGSAFARGIPYSYADPCKTAMANLNQAKWQESHTTPNGTHGGAAGWDELEVMARAAGDGIQADIYKQYAQDMRDDAMDFEKAGKKALLECMPHLIAEGPDGGGVHLAALAWEQSNTYVGQGLVRPLTDNLPAAPQKIEKKAEKSLPVPGGNKLKPPKHGKILRLYSSIDIPGMMIGDGPVGDEGQFWDGPVDMIGLSVHRHHARHRESEFGANEGDGMSGFMEKRRRHRMNSEQSDFGVMGLVPGF